MEENTILYSRGVTQEECNAMIRKVYVWMFAALMITGLTAFYVANSPMLLSYIFASKALFWLIIIAEFALVIGLSAAIHKMSAGVATAMFILYSVLNGLMMSTIFLAYRMGTIANVFFITSGTFGAMAVYGSITKKDLTRWGSLLLMALLGIIVATIVNIFLKSGAMDFVISGIGVIIFVGLTAYDAQKIKNMFSVGYEEETANKLAVLGALSLYLDFINLFLYLLRLFGRRD